MAIPSVKSMATDTILEKRTDRIYTIDGNVISWHFYFRAL